MPNPTDEMKVPINMLRLDGNESETVNPFTREPSQRFKEAFRGKSLAYIFLVYGPRKTRCLIMKKKAFLKGFNSKMEKDASLVYDKIIAKPNVEKWQILARALVNCAPQILDKSFIHLVPS